MKQGFLHGFDILKIPIVDENGNSNWPEVFSIDAINRMRDRVGIRLFMSQMMLEVIPIEKIRLDPNRLIEYDSELITYRGEGRLGQYSISNYSVYWDPSSGRARADGSVCALLFFDAVSKNVFIHDVLYIRVSDDDLYPMKTQCRAVLNFLRRYDLNVVGIEVNGVGSAIPEILRQEAKIEHFQISIVPIINHEKKELRIMDAIEPILSSGKMYVNNRVMDSNLITEMSEFNPIGKNKDDGMDAVAGAMRMQKSAIRVRGVRQVFSAKTDFKV